LYRCFPHIVNIATQAFLVIVSPSSKKKRQQDTTAAAGDDQDASDFDGLESDPEDVDDAHVNEEIAVCNPNYEQSLKSDVLRKTRKLVAAVRGSGKRRGRLAEIQREESQPQLQLLKDMTVRWSSTHMMVERVLEAYPVSTILFLFFLHI
jgi:hypothetical protein